MTRTTIVVSLSVGTAFMCALAIAVLSAAIVAGGHASNPLAPLRLWNTSATPKPPTYPKAGAIGELNRLKNDIQYGPVNVDAAKEVKNGLFDRIRANRQARQAPPTACNPQNVTRSVSEGHVTRSVSEGHVTRSVSEGHVTRSVSEGHKPIAVTSACRIDPYQIVDPSDCNATQLIANAQAQGLTILPQSIGVTQSIGVEMPSVVPLFNQEPRTKNQEPNCTCKADPRNVKTGSFICSNCRHSQVGEWHTDWNESGQPITFLCSKCYDLMTPAQRDTAYRAYLARQTKTVGVTGLLHQELSK